MSEQDGLSKLTAYLQQTRKQAEQSIDLLNTKIASLVDENEAVTAERDHFRNYSQQLKLENSQKWRLQERDDWKSLVDSVQIDRGRLQDNCNRLEIELEEARANVKILEEEINMFMNNGRANSSGETDSDSNEIILVEGDGDGEDGSGSGSGTSDRTQDLSLNLNATLNKSAGDSPIPYNGSGTGNGESPSRKASSGGGGNPGASLKLQVELHRAIAQLEAERKVFALEKDMRENKIAELEDEISRHRRRGLGQGTGTGQGVNGAMKKQDKIITLPQGSVQSSHSHRGGNFLYTVPHNLYSFLFSPGSIVLQTPILNV